MKGNPVRSIRLGVFGLLALFCGYNLNSSVHRFDGIVGMTRKNGYGCYCHSFAPTPSVRVWIEGPATLQPGERGSYRLMIVGDSTRTAGFNIASAFGSLEVADSLWTYWYEGELTHAVPRPGGPGDTVSWDFNYVAPPNDGQTIDTLYSVGNSTNQDTMATEADHWNFGENFLVAVSSVTGVSTAGTGDLPSDLFVSQNYPNPFNPVTTFRFDVAREATLRITLYDVTGRFITLVDERTFSAGSHDLVLDANRLGLASSVYLCRFETAPTSTTPGATVVKKLAFIR